MTTSDSGEHMRADTKARAVINLMEDRFTSGNSIPVERAFIKRDEWDAIVSEISRLDTGLFKAWDDLNELRQDAHEAETRVFNLIDGHKPCPKINVVGTVESSAGITVAGPVTDDKRSPEK